VQFKELCTRYGPIEFFWMDHAREDGGLSHFETVKWVHRFQPNCFVGFNHGEPAGRLCIHERGRPEKLGDASITKYNRDAEQKYRGHLGVEFTYYLNPAEAQGRCTVVLLFAGTRQSLSFSWRNLSRLPGRREVWEYFFSPNIGPPCNRRLREIDVKTLREVGTVIRNPPPSVGYNSILVKSKKFSLRGWWYRAFPAHAGLSLNIE